MLVYHFLIIYITNLLHPDGPDGFDFQFEFRFHRYHYGRCWKLPSLLTVLAALYSYARSCCSPWCVYTQGIWGPLSNQALQSPPTHAQGKQGNQYGNHLCVGDCLGGSCFPVYISNFCRGFLPLRSPLPRQTNPHKRWRFVAQNWFGSSTSLLQPKLQRMLCEYSVDTFAYTLHQLWYELYYMYVAICTTCRSTTTELYPSTTPRSTSWTIHFQ